MNYQQLLEQIRAYVLNYYHTHDTSTLIYHNQQHTENVAAAATQIANHYQLSDHDFFIVIAAVWFHDTGYLTHPENHENTGAHLAEGFLNEHGIDDADIQLVKNCIAATKMPQSAITLPEQIVCDADLFHLGMDDFFKKDNLLLKEFNTLHHMDTDKLEWREKSIGFLENHTYYTDYCKMLLNDKQAENLKELHKKVKKSEKEDMKDHDDHQKHKKQEAIDTEEMPPIIEGQKEQGKNKKIKAKDKPEKGIETMFRISSSNHQRLSDMADGKAHIMITVNSIILSAIISLVLRRLDAYGFLIVPSFMLLSVSLVAMIFAILSTRPSIPKGTFTHEQVEERKVNLLFFGNFYKMPLADFNDGMRQMMEDSDFLYGTLIRDLYAQGVVLGKKYHLLRISYNIFMYGLIISVAGFIVTFLFFNHPAAPALVPKTN